MGFSFSRSRSAAQRVSQPSGDLDPLAEFLPETPGPDPATVDPVTLAAPPSGRRAPGASKVLAIVAVVVVGAALAGVAAYRRTTAVAADTASLRVESDPPGAPVQIDGTSRGITPMTIALPPGHHSLAVGDEPRRKTLAVDLAARTTTVHHIELPAAVAAGSLEVTAPAPATVTVDGIDRGAAPAVIGDLSPGEHQVVVTSQGTSYRRTVNVTSGAPSALVISDVPTAAAGWLSAPAAVPLTILEQGHVVGTTESERLMLPAGDHQFEFRSDALGFRVSRRATITAGRVSTVRIELPQVPLQINAVPWAEVWIDGRRIGETPLANVMQTIGPHEVVFRNPQFGERRLNTTLTMETPARATIDMRTR